MGNFFAKSCSAGESHVKDETACGQFYFCLVKLSDKGRYMAVMPSENVMGRKEKADLLLMTDFTIEAYFSSALAIFPEQHLLRSDFFLAAGFDKSNSWP